MTPGIFRYRLNRQILFIFLIINFLLIVSIIFTNRTINRFGEEIKYIDETTIGQLRQINNIVHNAGVRRQAVLIYLFSNNAEKEQEAIQLIEELQEENKTYFAVLDRLIKEDSIQMFFARLMMQRETYTNSINRIIALKQAGEISNIFDEDDDNDSRLEHHYNTYVNALEKLSDILTEKSDKEIDDVLADLEQRRSTHNSIIVVGSISILALIISVLLVATNLTKDFIALEKETKERIEAEKMLKLAIEELEAKSFELNKLNQDKDKFISVISHDLRNPISSIIGSSSLLLDHAVEIDQKDSRRIIEIINKSSRNILQQLNDLIALAQSADTKKFFSPVVLNLHDEVNNDVRFLWDLVEKKDIEIKNQIDNNIFIEADKFMFRSILQNLLTNALKYTGKGGKVTLSSKTHEQMVDVMITDTGIGMTEEEKEKLFSGNITSKPGTEEEKGTGMGLKLVKDFVEKHKGTIEVMSEEGKGTSVTITFPLAKLNH